MVRLVKARARAVVVIAALLALLTGMNTTNAGFTSSTVNAGLTFQMVPADTGCSVNPAWLTGFESGVISTSGATITPTAALFSAVAGSANIDTTTVRAGNAALKVVKSNGASSYVERTDVGTPVAVAVRFAIRLPSLPAAGAEFARIRTTAGNDGALRFNSAGNTFQVAMGGASASSAATTAGVWHVIDMSLDVSASPRTLKWRIDGVAQTAINNAETASTIAGVRLGSANSTDVYTANYDDVLVTGSAAGYPLNDGQTLPLVPNAYVGKSDGSGYLQTQVPAAVGATSWGLLDESPMTSLSDYVQQTGTDANAYAEYGFEDVARQGCVNGVSGLASLASSTTTATLAKTSVFEGGVERVLNNDDFSPGNSTLEYRARGLLPATSGWTASKLTGTTARIGYRNSAGSTPYWHGLMLEYDQVVNAATAYSGVVNADSPAGYWRLGDKSGTTAVATTGTPGGTYNNGVVLDNAGAVGDSNAGAYLDGTDDDVTFGDVYDFAGTSSFTVEAWVKPGAATASYRRVVSKESATNGGWDIEVWPTGANANYVSIARKDSAGTSDYRLSNAALPSERWSHVVGTYDGTNIRLYVNGVLQGAALASSRAVENHSLPLTFGRSSAGATPFSGGLDEVAVYNSALSAARVSAHYAAGTS